MYLFHIYMDICAFLKRSACFWACSPPTVSFQHSNQWSCYNKTLIMSLLSLKLSYLIQSRRQTLHNGRQGPTFPLPTPFLTALLLTHSSAATLASLLSLKSILPLVVFLLAIQYAWYSLPTDSQATHSFNSLLKMRLFQ